MLVYAVVGYITTLHETVTVAGEILSGGSIYIRRGTKGRKENAPKQILGENLSFFTRNNFLVFEIESEQRANTLVTFCTCISLTSVGLMLTITVPYVGDNQFPFIVFSPSVQSEMRNWNNGGYSVRMLVVEYMTLSEIVVQRDDQQVE
ncbi:hypothetical protein Lser_V15G41266 [Lactuca serriola]